MGRKTNFKEPRTMTVGGHIVYGFDENGLILTAQFLPDNENVDLLPKCSIKKCSAFVRRDGTLDMIISKIEQQK